MKKIWRIGLIADTHFPPLLETLPSEIFDAFADVDYILHAGDVGSLSVLDQLSTLAPVVAVHGNDDTHDATAALPFLQTVGIGGQRIVLTHGHYPDWQEELAHRRDDRWHPKLQRYVNMARQHGAKLFVSGHTHIPLANLYEGIWLINPGTVIYGNAVTRQKVRTIARMTFDVAGNVAIEHLNLNDYPQTYVPQVDFSRGFQAAAAPCTVTIFDEQVQSQLMWIRQYFSLEEKALLTEALLPIARVSWLPDAPLITPFGLVQAMKQAGAIIPASLMAKLGESEIFAPHL